jgi:hypothetical protein
VGELLFKRFSSRGDNSGDLTLGEAKPFADLRVGEILIEKEVDDLLLQLAQGFHTLLEQDAILDR